MRLRAGRRIQLLPSRFFYVDISSRDLFQFSRLGLTSFVLRHQEVERVALSVFRRRQRRTIGFVSFVPTAFVLGVPGGCFLVRFYHITALLGTLSYHGHPVKLLYLRTWSCT